MSTRDDLNAVGGAAKGVTATVEELTGSVEELAKSLTTLSNAGFQTKSGFDNLTNGIKGVAGSTADFTKSVENILEKVPILGNVTSAVLGPLALVASTVEKSIGAVSGAMTAAMKVMDASSEPFRKNSAALWEMERAFAGSYETADKFTNLMLRTVATPFARQTYMSSEALLEMAQATKGTSIHLSELGDSIETGAGSMNLWATATAHAASIGMGAGQYMTRLNEAMNLQGMSAQQAVEQMAMFGSIASETGLNIDDISTSLNSAASGFQKIGMSADFGRPFIEGFADSLTSMGFGIENALSLTQSLSSALGGLTENYGLAYITFQRGGLDIGGGGGTGVLGASIGLQSAMMDAEKTGDQANIAATMAGGLRDTLASFTGGSIVTVGDANESPAMQAAFYTQQQLLTKQYGMDQQSATRTLEMLAGLDDAVQSGDTDMQKELQKQISEQMNADTKTLDLQEKMNRGIGSAVALLMANNRMMYEQTRLMGDETVGGWLSAGTAGLEQLDEFLQSTAGSVSESGGFGTAEARGILSTASGSFALAAGAEGSGREMAGAANLAALKAQWGGRYQDLGEGRETNQSGFAQEYRRRRGMFQEQANREASAEALRRRTEQAEIEEAELAAARDAAQNPTEGESTWYVGWDEDWKKQRRQERRSAAGMGAGLEEGETDLSVIGKNLVRLLNKPDPVRRIEIVPSGDLLAMHDHYAATVTGTET